MVGQAKTAEGLSTRQFTGNGTSLCTRLDLTPLNLPRLLKSIDYSRSEDDRLGLLIYTGF